MPDIKLDFTSTYILSAINEERNPEHLWFRDRYFPTGEGDIFTADKVLTEYRVGSRKMAAFVAPRIGSLPVERQGYEVHEYEPAQIGVSRSLSADDLNKRGFGEAIYSQDTPAKRAKKLLMEDLDELDARISRREEWMCVQTMLNNACDMQEYTDNGVQGELKHVQFYGASSDHTYTIGSNNEWNKQTGNFFGDVAAMAKKLKKRGLPATDLLLGADVAAAIGDIQKVRDLLDKNSGIRVGEKLELVEKFPGITYMGTLNFGGTHLDLYCIDETYEADDGTDTAYFPSKGALVTAPGCGHLMYGQITQIPFRSENFETFAKKRVPKFDVEGNTRKIELAARPLAAPKKYSPWIYAANVVD